jgi:hypothetical protein
MVARLWWAFSFHFLHPHIKAEWATCLELQAYSRHGNESLDAFALENLAGVDDSFGVHGNHVEPEELAAVLAHAAHLTDDFAVVAVQEPDVVVGEIGDVQQPLLPVGREHHAAGRAADAGFGRNDELIQELAFVRCHVDAVRAAVRGVDQSIIRYIQREMAAELPGFRTAECTDGPRRS